jgi:carboxymethylenebutenolidase
MLLLWGEQDNILPEHRDQVTTAMREAKKEYVNIVFSNADHGFFCDARQSYETNAARLSWDTVLSFLNIRMG